MIINLMAIQEEVAELMSGQSSQQQDILHDACGASQAGARRPGWTRALLCTLALLLGLALPQWPAGASQLAAPAAASSITGIDHAGDGMHGGSAAVEEPHSWLLKHAPGQADALPGVEVLHRQPEASVLVVRPASEGTDVEAWLQRLRETPGVEYVHPNGRVQVLTAPAAGPSRPNDPELSRQAYLNQIGAPKAWETYRDQTALTIALIDTGVDLEHEDLKPNLVAGVNLVHPNRSAQDDNGHGTSVAGVLGAVGNNGKGISGILWNARIMPIKALDAKGFGDEDRLGEGILYAVKNGAQIVVLSVGLYRYSPYMRDIVQYAESQGVLLIAATGNDGVLHGSKAAVKYPAGYPPVLAVGGATSSGQPEPRSNPGSEVDLVAPWNVYTTALGGGYMREEGTSMAAPQVAAAAALVWAKYPDLKPYQVRALLRQSAKDIGPKGWDPATGYGLLQIDAALTIPYKPDAAEPNDNRASAFLFPLQTRISGQLTSGKDKDWFLIDVPHDGTLTIQFQGLTSPGQLLPPVRMTHYAENNSEQTLDLKIGNKSVDWNVSKGKNYIELQFDDTSQSSTLPYLLTSDFTIAPDAYEPNDRNVEAFTLPARSQTITGTFHKTGDQDWFSMTFTQGGTLKLSMETDTIRIDPAMAIGKVGEGMLEIDEHGDGKQEQSTAIAITPGKYYIKAHNAASREASPVVGTYQLKLDFVTVYDDPNEPNNHSYEATSVRIGTEYVGVFGAKDEDWFQLRLNDESIASLSVSDIPTNRIITMDIMDRSLKVLFTVKNKPGQSKLSTNRKLVPGQYFVKLTSDAAFNHQYYQFKITADTIIAGFRDIEAHWASSAIIALSDKQIISGYGDYRFEPNRGITRAEAVAVLVKAFDPAAKSTMTFNDMPTSHWAADSVAKAVQAGWIKGYPDGSFAPDQYITRAEMAMMLGAALKMRAMASSTAPFADVAMDHWAAPMLTALKNNGIIGGYEGNRYKPNATASRAEFAVLVYRSL